MNLQNSYLQLPEILFQKTNPTPVQNPQFVVFNQTLADELGLDSETLSKRPEYFSGNLIFENSIAISQAYAGHQFGHFAILGDGRAHLLGEFKDKKGRLFDLQLKGSGPSPYSRRGDGRAALGPMLREYIISEALAALKIPTTRSLAVVATGEVIFRETPKPGAILTRIAASHIRVGTFQYALAQDGIESVKALADYSIARHYPEILNSEDPYLHFLEKVVDRQAELISQWMNIGFIHGVMNTDNMTISGESIDFGPCAFLDTYHPSQVFSSIDHQGRYAFENQPKIAEWNLYRLAETLLPLIDSDFTSAKNKIIPILENFSKKYDHFFYSQFRAKIGLTETKDSDLELMQNLLQWMQITKADFTQTFYDLTYSFNTLPTLYASAAFIEWKEQWTHRLKQENYGLEQALDLMKSKNPIVIPRNYLVEEALSEAANNSNFTAFHDLVQAVKNPFSDQNIQQKYKLVLPNHQESYKTFCGT